MTFKASFLYLYLVVIYFVSRSNTGMKNRNYELHNLYSSQIIIRMMKEKGHAAYTAERVANKVFNLITWRKDITGTTQPQIG